LQHAICRPDGRAVESPHVIWYVEGGFARRFVLLLPDDQNRTFMIRHRRFTRSA
jgi:hypothetical protein